MKTKSFVILVCMLMILVNLSFLSTADDTSVGMDMIQFKQIQNIHYKNSDMLNEKTLSETYSSLNNPPNTPSQPSGPTSVTVGYWYLYTTVTTDPDGDNISYGWDGGDGIVNYWTGYQPSGVTCQVYIKFLDIGTYKLQVKAKDEYGAESSFSIPLYVTSSGSTTNHPPYIPANPNPANQATNVDIDKDLSWTGGDPDVGDSVTYDVYFGSSLPLSKTAANISTPYYNPGLLFQGLTYYWFIVAWDTNGASTPGPTWYFTTIESTNNPPIKPTLTGPVSGKTGKSYTYTAMTTDPENDEVYYLFDWDDGTDSRWDGPYLSGDVCQKSHVWNTKGSYAVKVKAKDANDAESVWSDPLEISMPKFKPYLTFLEESFPFFFNLFFS